MTKTSASRRISSAMASRRASRMVMVTSSVPSGTSGSGVSSADGGLAVPVLAGAVASAFLAGSGFSAGGADSAPFCCCAGCSGFAGCFGAPPLPLRLSASSPSPRIMAIGVLTATSLVPSGTRILPSVPSSTASTSMVALSVSISAITSPDLTLSPSFLSHLARLPFSMVGERAGINTSVGMAAHIKLDWRRGGSRSAINVGVKLGGIRLGIVSGEFRRFVDDGAYRRVDLLQLVFARPFLVEKPLAHLLDRIVLGAHFVDFLLGAVLGRIRHRVAAIAIGQHFQNDRTLAGAAPSQRVGGRGLHCAHVHAVDLRARDVERR